MVMSEIQGQRIAFIQATWHRNIVDRARDGFTDAIVERFKSLGYTYVSLDLAGYRTGSMNAHLAMER